MRQQPSDQAGLQRAFKILDEDVLVNRTGRLSPRQAGNLRRSAVANACGALIIAGGIIAVLFTVAAKPLAWYQYLICGVIAVTGLLLGLVVIRGLLRAAAAGVVESAEGPVSLQLRGRNGWFLTVDGRSLRLPVSFWHVAAGHPYRVYVAPAAKRIVAMERLSP